MHITHAHGKIYEGVSLESFLRDQVSAPSDVLFLPVAEQFTFAAYKCQLLDILMKGDKDPLPPPPPTSSKTTKKGTWVTPRGLRKKYVNLSIPKDKYFR